MTKKVTKAQLNSLHKIIGEIERLQHWLPEGSDVPGLLQRPKRELMDVQRKLEAEYDAGK